MDQRGIIDASDSNPYHLSLFAFLTAHRDGASSSRSLPLALSRVVAAVVRLTLRLAVFVTAPPFTLLGGGWQTVLSGGGVRPRSGLRGLGSRRHACFQARYYEVARDTE